MNILVDQEKLSKIFIPKKFTTFGTHCAYKQKLDYDIRILWCYTKPPKKPLPNSKETQEFMSLIFAPHQYEPIGIANHPMLRSINTELHTSQLWTNKKIKKTQESIKTLELFSNVKTPFTRKQIGNNWKQVHQFLYQL